MSEKRKYTLGEEIFNSVSHGVGACLSVAGTAVMIVASVIHTDVWGIVSSCIYGASLIILYTMSTLYHSFTNKKAKAFFRIMDHNTIFLLIAGTYTPITLYYLQGAVGWILFGIVWGAAIFGIVMNSINLEKARIPSIFCYVAMGWVIIFAIDTILIAHHISICQTCHNAKYFTCIFNNRRSILHTRNYILRNKKGKILSLNMASLHHCRQCFSLLCNLTRILEYITKSDCLRAVAFH